MNLAVTYAMMNREQFTERFAALFEKYQMDEEKLMQLSDSIMDELDKWRERKNMADTIKDATASGNSSMEEQLATIVEELRKINEQLAKKTED